METTAGTVIMILIAVALSVLLFIFLYKTVKLQLFVLGTVGGFFAGTLLYGAILSASGYSEIIWLKVLTVSITCLLGGLAAYWEGEWLILFVTSFVGAYLLMRGFAFYFGGLPSESAISFKVKYGLPLVRPHFEVIGGDPAWYAWGYYAFCGVCFAFNYYFQTKHWHTVDPDQEGYRRGK